MLDSLRGKGLTSFVMGAVIIATVLVFVIQFNPSAGKKAAKLTETCAATVRGHCIEPSEHRAAYMMLVPRDDKGARLLGQAQQMGLPRIALDGLIERELLVSEADRIGLTVSDDEVQTDIISGFVHVSLPAARPELGMSLRVFDGLMYYGYAFKDPTTKEFDLKTYKRNLKNLTGLSNENFMAEQKREILAAKMRDMVRAPVRVSEAEALETYTATKSSAILEDVEVKGSFVERYVLQDSPHDLDAWAKDPKNAKVIAAAIDQRQKAPGAPKQGLLRHILIKVAPTASPTEKAEALAKLTEAYVRIKRGETFFKVAKEVGEDGTKDKGGSLETDKTDAFVPAFKKAADALKPGQMTQQAIETEFGYHLIARDDASTTARDIAREIYTRSQDEQTTKTLATKIIADVKGGKSMDEAVTAEMGDLKAIPLLSVVHDPSLADAGAPAAPGGADASVDTTADAGAPAAPPQTSLDPATDSDRPLAASTASFNRTGDPLPRLNPESMAKVLDFSFAATSKDGDLMSEPVLGTDGFYVVRLKQHKAATKEEFEKERDTFMQTLLATRQAEALAIYMKRLRDASKADITIDEEYMAEWTKDAGADDEGY